MFPLFFGCRYNRSAELRVIKVDNAKTSSMEVNFSADDAVIHSYFVGLPNSYIDYVDGCTMDISCGAKVDCFLCSQLRCIFIPTF